MRLVGVYPRRGRPYKKDGLYEYLLKNCGLEQYSKGVTSGILLDKVGASGTEVGREAVQALTGLGDGVSYLEAIEFANEALTYIDATTDLPVVSAFNGSGQFIIPVNGIKTLITQIGALGYDLDINPDNNVLSLIPSDGSAQIDVQQENAPAVPTEINITQVDRRDLYGYSVEKGQGDNRFNEFDITTPLSGTIRVGEKYFSDVRGSTSIWYSRIYSKDISDATLSYLTDDNQELKAVFSDVFADSSADAISLTSSEPNIVNGDILNNVDAKQWLYITFRAAVSGVSGYVENLQVQLGSSILPYESYLGITRDSAGLLPYRQGYKVPNDENNIPVGFINGVKFKPDYVKRVKENYEVVDGVVDCRQAYSVNGDPVIADCKVTFTSDGATTQDVRFPSNAWKSNTLYTLYYAITNSDVGTDAFSLNSFGVSADFLALQYVNGIYAITFTTDAVLTEDFLRLVFSAVIPITESLTIEAVIYEGDKTVSQPTPGAIEVGNSAILSDQYNIRYINDTNNISSLNGVNKVMPFADMAENQFNQMYFNIATGKLAFMEAPISGTCEEKLLKEMGFNTAEFAIDSEGEYAVDTEGYFAIEEV